MPHEFHLLLLAKLEHKDTPLPFCQSQIKYEKSIYLNGYLLKSQCSQEIVQCNAI